MNYEPETPEAKILVPIRDQIRAGHSIMSRKFMLQILMGLAYPFYNGLSLMDRDIGAMCQAEQNLHQEWIYYAEPVWLDTLTDLLAHPTAQLQLGNPHYDDHLTDVFTSFFVDIAARFPDKASSVLELLLNDKTIRENEGDYLLEEITEEIKKHQTATQLGN